MLKFMVGFTVGAFFGMFMLAAVQMESGTAGRSNYAAEYAKSVCPSEIRWEGRTFYCLDDNGNWIKEGKK